MPWRRPLRAPQVIARHGCSGSRGPRSGHLTSWPRERHCSEFDGRIEVAAFTVVHAGEQVVASTRLRPPVGDKEVAAGQRQNTRFADIAILSSERVATRSRSFRTCTADRALPDFCFRGALGAALYESDKGRNRATPVGRSGPNSVAVRAAEIWRLAEGHEAAAMAINRAVRHPPGQLPRFPKKECVDSCRGDGRLAWEEQERRRAQTGDGRPGACRGKHEVSGRLDRRRGPSGVPASGAPVKHPADRSEVLFIPDITITMRREWSFRRGGRGRRR